MCERCNRLLKSVGKKEKQLSLRLRISAKRNAPLSKSYERVTLALKQKRLKCCQLETKIKKMKLEIGNKYVPLDIEISDDISKNLAKNVDQATTFTKLFWDQQQKFLAARRKHFATIP